MATNPVKWTDPFGEAAVKNNSNKPVPYKPEDCPPGAPCPIKLCQPGMRCDGVDGVYVPADCKTNPYKVIDTCDVEVTASGDLSLTCGFSRPLQWIRGGRMSDSDMDKHKGLGASEPGSRVWVSMQVRRRGVRFYAVAAALIAVLFAALMLGGAREERVYAVGNERAESSLEGLRSILSRLIDPVLPLILEEHTTYAPGFREEVFRSLRAGLTEKDVRQALGAPLSERMLADGRKILYYSEQATPTENYLMRLVVLDGQGRLLERHAEFYVD